MQCNTKQDLMERNYTVKYICKLFNFSGCVAEKKTTTMPTWEDERYHVAVTCWAYLYYSVSSNISYGHHEGLNIFLIQKTTSRVQPTDTLTPATFQSRFSLRLMLTEPVDYYGIKKYLMSLQ